MANLHVITCEPTDQSVIEKLEETLDRARKGELSSVAIAMVTRDGCCGETWSRAPSMGTLLGAIEALKFRLLRDWVDA